MAGILRVDQANVDIINAKTAGGKVFIPGHIIQVQSTTKTDAWTAAIAAGTWTDIPGLTVAITPVLATSKILVTGHMYGNGQSTLTQFFFRIVRDSTPICIADAVGTRMRATGRTYVAGASVTLAMPFTHLDSPATTSTTTYKIQATTEASTYSLYLNRTQDDTDGAVANGVRTTSTITVMEIAQ
jgi:hypothetical protein